MNKKIALMLIIALSASTIVSCGGDVQENIPDSTATSDSSEPESTDTGIVSRLTDELKEKLGLDGYEFNVLLRPSDSTWSTHDLIADEQNGDILNDAVYDRNRWLNEQCGFVIKGEYCTDPYFSEMATYILSGDSVYDAYFPPARFASSSATQGLLYDLKELAYLDLDADCWNHMFDDALTFGGKLFYATGAITTNSFDSVRLFMFNKTIAAKNKLEDPYELVRAGKWTFDAFDRMAVGAAADLNGDSEMTYDDQWGMAWQSAIGGIIFYYGAGESVTSKDKDDLPVISVGSERSMAVYEKVLDMISDKRVYNTGANADIFKAFYDGHSLFLTEVLDAAKSLRPYDVDFGILPVPKYDENQSEYVQYVDGWCLSPIVVPVNVENPDRAGFVIQALAEASKQYLVQPYYDKVLTGKALRDDESAEMLDIVVNNFVLENSDIYQWTGIDIKTALDNGDSLASVVAAGKSALQGKIDKTTERIIGSADK